MHLLADSGGMFSGVGLFVYLIFLALYIAAGWMVFQKAGQAGWKWIIPIYNIWVLLKVVGRPGWWLLLFLIPIVNIIIWFIIAIDLSKSFGHGVGLGIGIAILPYIFLLVLGFGSATYQGPAGGMGSAPAPPMPA